MSEKKTITAEVPDFYFQFSYLQGDFSEVIERLESEKRYLDNEGHKNLSIAINTFGIGTDGDCYPSVRIMEERLETDEEFEARLAHENQSYYFYNNR